ncbi:hypothetical protein Osc7112_2653 [Oscillatoria nigro-viridis PCC 7112]|uniref:Uncharacterized protein n=1 Tax=Phormidium nigroviride PCC 7112 TaxID=179408 RepID=K9VHW1_9CYAN|nr:hypothetical protein [Oscillatoria nigro-viridis]AFZ07067.1 hypothetical protein Osc7112_2653 [Oscillatoria nigro-viridis PCC 7112]
MKVAGAIALCSRSTIYKPLQKPVTFSHRQGDRDGLLFELKQSKSGSDCSKLNHIENKDLIMPIIFVHGVSSRMDTKYEKAWEKTRANLRKYIAPVISASGDPDDVLIDNAFWGDLSVQLRQGRTSSLPDDKRVQAILKRKKGWIDRKIVEFQKIPDSDKAEYLLDLIPEVGKKLHDLPGYFFGRFVDPLRKPLNESVTLFLGDVFFYLAKRGTADHPGKISYQLLNTLEKAHKDKIAKGEKLIVFSHSMGGQIVYDIVSYFLPQMSQLPQYTTHKYKDIYIDFWCAAASQVGLFKEMKVFKQDDDGQSASSNQEFLELDLGVEVLELEATKVGAEHSSEKVEFPSDHLNILWNLWDDSDYLSFTAEPLIKEVLDDLYDSGKSPVSSHTNHFDDPEFYKEFALLIREAQEVEWCRQMFLDKLQPSNDVISENAT